MKTIVVVDDNQDFLETLKEFIELQKGFKCVAFSNPDDTLQYVLHTKEIHAIISDFEMPEMSGIVLAKKIIEKLPAMKLIIMSGHSINYLKRIVLNAGIADKVQLLCKSHLNCLVSLLSD